MPTTVWFSLLALVYVLSMASYHGFFLVTRFVLPEPRERAMRDWKSVLSELFLTLAILAPLLRRIVPVLTWVRGPSTTSAVAIYVATFAWLPFMKAFALLGSPAGSRHDAALRVLYSVPMTVLYLMGIGYVLCVTVSMMVLR
ncbi:MAG: hypothetical protein P4L84_30035 [Isosphaeraceae bacterium]|nr:hypothetical protein [Isosphaeraceae bacterium]